MWRGVNNLKSERTRETWKADGASGVVCLWELKATFKNQKRTLHPCAHPVKNLDTSVNEKKKKGDGGVTSQQA